LPFTQAAKADCEDFRSLMNEPKLDREPDAEIVNAPTPTMLPIAWIFAGRYFFRSCLLGEYILSAVFGICP
jgi:hypothetical protein